MKTQLVNKNLSVVRNNDRLLRSVGELTRLLSLGNSGRPALLEAERVLCKIPQDRLQALFRLGLAGQVADRDPKAIQAYICHVLDQHLKPMAHDRIDLVQAFGIDPDRLGLLMAVHDLGKLAIPANLQPALSFAFPEDSHAQSILGHEFSSMAWVEILGRSLKFPQEEILAIQTLLANHNFGPDLARSGNERLSRHWWPRNFRERFLPGLRNLGIDATWWFSRDQRGCAQYGTTESSVYASLLAVYDRAIASPFNEFGMQTLAKFAEETRESLGDEAAQRSALEAKAQVASLWKSLFESHLSPQREPGIMLEKFAPYRRHISALQTLQERLGVYPGHPLATDERTGEIPLSGEVLF